MDYQQLGKNTVFSKKENRYNVAMKKKPLIKGFVDFTFPK